MDSEKPDGPLNQKYISFYNLTTREKEVLKHIQKGCKNKEIGVCLDISCNTVKTHLDNIFRKLKVKNRTQAAMKATQLKIINP